MSGSDELVAEEMMYRASDPAEMSVRSEGDTLTMEGRMMPYGEWTEVRSYAEGHFLERFAPGSLAKTIAEQSPRIRALFEHGMDVTMGRQAIAAIEEMREEDDGAHFRASLLDGLPNLIVSGLRRGLYGSSIRFTPLKMDRVRSPRPSVHNPDGLEERTVREASMREFSVTAFPVYAGATAHVRSITDEILLGRFADDPARLEEMIAFMESKRTIVEPDPPEDTTPPPAEPDLEPEPSAATTRAEPGTPTPPRFNTREEWLTWIRGI